MYGSPTHVDAWLAAGALQLSKSLSPFPSTEILQLTWPPTRLPSPTLSPSAARPTAELSAGTVVATCAGRLIAFRNPCLADLYQTLSRYSELRALGNLIRRLDLAGELRAKGKLMPLYESTVVYALMIVLFCALWRAVGGDPRYKQSFFAPTDAAIAALLPILDVTSPAVCPSPLIVRKHRLSCAHLWEVVSLVHMAVGIV